MLLNGNACPGHQLCGCAANGSACAVPAASPRPASARPPEIATVVTNREIRLMVDSLRRAPPLWRCLCGQYRPWGWLPIPTNECLVCAGSGRKASGSFRILLGITREGSEVADVWD